MRFKKSGPNAVARRSRGDEERTLYCENTPVGEGFMPSPTLLSSQGGPRQVRSVYEFIKNDGFVKSQKSPFSVIPVKTGIQENQGVLDSRLRGSDDVADFLQIHQRSSIPFFHHSGFFGPVAQLAEQLTLNQLAEGSNPSRPTSNIKRLAELGQPFSFFPESFRT